MKRLNATIGKICLATVLLASTEGSATPVNFMLDYLSVPSTATWVERDLVTGAQEATEETAGMGTLGIRLGVGVPVAFDPFTISVETGLGLAAGTRTFAHSLMVRSTAGETRERKNDGDFTEWEVTTVPLMFKIRYLPPADGVTLGGDIGFGPVLLGVSTDRTIAKYDSYDNLLLRETENWNETKLAVAVEMNGGVVVPVSSSLRVELMGTIMWMSKVPAGRVRDYPRPTAVYGYTADDPSAPALQLGGIGYGARVGLTVGL
jgi:hypothetical protein